MSQAVLMGLLPYLIFRVSCSHSVRLISGRLLAQYETGQITCYKTGRIMNSQQ